ncbi:MAG: cupredoxin domain-containing protein [Thermoleophilaceae bacterium]
MTRSALTLAALVLLAAGCGGNDRPGGTVTAPAGGSVRVKAKEYSFDPSTIVVRGGGTLRLTLANKGTLAHNIKVEKDGRIIGGTPAFPAGETRSATVRLASGTYEFLCTVGDHAELGMKGELKVD